MNILIVNMSIDPVFGGGTVERTCQLAKELRNLPNTNAKVLSTTAGLSELHGFDEAEYILLPCLSKRWYLPAPYFGKVYQSIKWADMIILSSHWTLLNAMVYFVNKVLSRPYMFCPAGALHVFGRSGLIKRIYNIIIGNGILLRTNRVIAIPKEERDFISTLGVSRERIAVIPNGISPSDFVFSDTSRFRAKYSLVDAPFILFMGRLNEIKGPDILLQAFIRIAEHHPEWHLVFAGPDGGMEKGLKKTLVENSLEKRVHFIGFISGQEKSEAYHAAQMLVIPSRLEAMSIVALEAGICCTPIVMTDQCGFSELVEAGGGLEVAVNAESLADLLLELMGDEHKLEVMGNKAQCFIRDNYTWEIAAKRHRQLCNEVFEELLK